MWKQKLSIQLPQCNPQHSFIKALAEKRKTKKMFSHICQNIKIGVAAILNILHRSPPRLRGESRGHSGTAAAAISTLPCMSWSILQRNSTGIRCVRGGYFISTLPCTHVQWNPIQTAIKKGNCLNYIFGILINIYSLELFHSLISVLTPYWSGSDSVYTADDQLPRLLSFPFFLLNTASMIIYNHICNLCIEATLTTIYL